SGADPAAVVEAVRAMVAAGAIAVQGNHDAAPEAWTRSRLPPASSEWLASLPLCLRGGPLCFVDARGADPGRWQYVDDAALAQESARAAQAAWTFGGHVHRQALFFETSTGRMAEFRPAPGVAVPVRRKRRWVALVGAVGQPRAAEYALF